MHFISESINTYSEEYKILLKVSHVLQKQLHTATETLPVSTPSISGGLTETSWNNSSSFSMLWNTEWSRVNELRGKKHLDSQCAKVKLSLSDCWFPQKRLQSASLSLQNLPSADKQKHGSGVKRAEWLRMKGARHYLLQVLQVLLVDLDPPPQEAAALGHFYIHRADVLLAVILTLPPQSAKSAERQTARLQEEND